MARGATPSDENAVSRASTRGTARGLNTVLKNSRNHQPQMNADERRWKTKDVSLYIGVYRRSSAA